ncbi:putative F-box domain, FBD domain, leucine-rich repeat domain superfamily [Helianthus annuus]|nr:putative F-box domain, FBD domain, leucine-rich repeat domain superfamily [Helianthus annuus]KAJ0814848.1 putative F-box domain, FBD domain, leucine-rich repeat domain superfamily [Helianthus annuus]KAJ0828068.1 putative F-box domain, FBD domain, leucine-rich repeat domain superfamily [Helianthus annuus]
MSSKKVDRLTRLPEEIRSHILSLMPTKFAVQTSILSKRWRYSWMFVTNLDFEFIPAIHGLNSFLESVDLVMELCKTSQLQSFRLDFPGWRLPNSRVSNWIDKAVRLNVRELDIEVIEQVELPLSLFTCKTLTKLRLKTAFRECPCRVNLPCLKTLAIFVYKNPFLNAFKLIAGCPVLESLYLKVSFYDGVEDYIFRIPTLKRLKLTFLCSPVVNKVVLDVPNLEYLFVGGTPCSIFVMKNVSSLVEASISLYDFTYDHLQKLTFEHLWAELLKGVSGVKSLSVKRMSSTLHLPTFLNMKHLELKSFWPSRRILQFLENSPELKHLYIEKLEGSCWIEPKLVPACMPTNLTTIKFSVYKWSKCDIPFLKYTLGNAEALKTVTITWANSRLEEESELCAELLKLSRASRYCEIHFLK